MAIMQTYIPVIFEPWGAKYACESDPFESGVANDDITTYVAVDLYPDASTLVRPYYSAVSLADQSLSSSGATTIGQYLMPNT